MELGWAGSALRNCAFNFLAKSANIASQRSATAERRTNRAHEQRQARSGSYHPWLEPRAAGSSVVFPLIWDRSGLTLLIGVILFNPANSREGGVYSVMDDETIQLRAVCSS